MNHTEFIYKDGSMMYFVCRTDGDPSELFWVWEIERAAVLAWLENYYGNKAVAGLSKITKPLADRFVNDGSLLEDSNEYIGGKAPICGVWYAPLTMDQVFKCFGITR